MKKAIFNDEELLSNECEKIIHENSRKVSHQKLQDAIKKNKENQRQEFIALALWTFIIITFTALSVIDICGL